MRLINLTGYIIVLGVLAFLLVAYNFSNPHLSIIRKDQMGFVGVWIMVCGFILISYPETKIDNSLIKKV